MSRWVQHKKKKFFHLKYKVKTNFAAGSLHVFPSDRKCRILWWDKFFLSTLYTSRRAILARVLTKMERLANGNQAALHF